MPDLAQSLGKQDLGYLQIVAELWGIEYSAQDFQLGLDRLVPLLLDEALLNEVIQALPGEARSALDDLLQNDGRMSWSMFTRRYGNIREMGSARRDRDRPYQQPVSSAEVLFYRALIGRAFFDTPRGAQEFAYIPGELRDLLTFDQTVASKSLGRTALPAERAHAYLATDHILDDACTLLAALRMDLPEDQVPLSSYPGEFPLSLPSLKPILAAAGLLEDNGDPDPEAIRHFLEADRGQALLQLVKNWQESGQIDELALLPQLELEGEWSTDPIRTRGTVLEMLAGIPRKTWWGLGSFIHAVHEHNPDYQRPAGDYDSWIIRLRESDTYLSGFESWDQVDGQLLRFMLTGFLHWLGVLDLASGDQGQAVAAFRFSGWSKELLQGEAPAGLQEDDQKMIARSDGRLVVSRHVPRAVRYQVARFCEWGELKRGDYTYTISPSSLKRAEEAGLRISHLLALLKKHAEQVPPNLVTALERFEQDGRQARMEQVLVLRVSSPEILEQLRSSRAARFLGDPLGPTTVIVKAGAREKVLAALVEMGYLGEMLVEDKDLN
jgi:hypothetical protein